MSHISKVDTKLQNLQCLKKALQTLGMTYAEAIGTSELTVNGYGKDERIEGCIMEIHTGCRYGIGIRQKGSQYEVVADWWAIETFTGEKQETLLNRITRQYAYETVMDKIRGLGYSVVQEESDTKNTTRIMVRKWA